ncbi:MAG: hypothetical protein QMD50_01550 [Patescibacteria group bacterium]|nr:hypothetical protein [Patescibacteria group bacterium]
MNKTIKYAGIAGILSLILAMPIIIFEVLKSLNNLGSGLVSLYIFTLLASLILYIVFIHGFKLVAEKYQNNLLKTSSYILIISAIVYYGYLVLTLISSNLDNMLIQILAMVIFGGASILFGIALLKLKPQFGSLVTGAGVVEIITGVSLLSVILSVIGILLLIPLYILTSMILFRAARKIETTPTV